MLPHRWIVALGLTIVGFVAWFQWTFHLFLIVLYRRLVFFFLSFFVPSFDAFSLVDLSSFFRLQASPSPSLSISSLSSSSLSSFPLWTSALSSSTTLRHRRHPHPSTSASLIAVEAEAASESRRENSKWESFVCLRSRFILNSRDVGYFFIPRHFFFLFFLFFPFKNQGCI